MTTRGIYSGHSSRGRGGGEGKSFHKFKNREDFGEDFIKRKRKMGKRRKKEKKGIEEKGEEKGGRVLKGGNYLIFDSLFMNIYHSMIKKQSKYILEQI